MSLSVSGRVIGQEKSLYRVLAEGGRTLAATLRGKFFREPVDPLARPVVGDEVECTPLDRESAVIEELKPRRTLLARKEPGTRDGIQALAANVDHVLIASALNQDHNPKRLERYLTLAWNSGAEPVLLLTKRDLAPDWEAHRLAAERRWPGVETHAVSGLEPETLAALSRYVSDGRTAVVVGSSGVGKSTLINALLGRAVLRTGEARADDDRGRHTTTSRTLWPTATGGFVIDTPGLRELQLTAETAGFELLFEDVRDLAAGCRFRDCRHDREPGCAVHAALAEGRLDPERWSNFLKMEREIDHQRRKTDPEARAREKARWKQIHKDMRQREKRLGKR